MAEVVSRLLKINLRARSKETVQRVLCDVLGGSFGHDRGADTIGDFEAFTLKLGGVIFDVVTPTGPESPLAKVIDEHGEGIDSICFAVEDMDYTRDKLQEHGIEFSRLTEFHGNQVAFVSRRETSGVALEFMQGPLVQKSLQEG